MPDLIVPQAVPSFDDMTPEQSQDIRIGLMTGPQAELYEALMQPFELNEHEFHPYHSFTYLKEFAIANRLNKILGGPAGWSKEIVMHEYFPAMEPHVKMGAGLVPISQFNVTLGPDGEISGGNMPANAQVIYDLDGAICIGFLEIKATGAKHYAIGGDIQVSLGKEPTTRKINTIKAADTDLLKRIARGVGVGLYLTELGNNIIPNLKVKDMTTLLQWLNAMYPDDVRYWEAERANAKMFEMLSERVPGKYPDRNAVGRKLQEIGLVRAVNRTPVWSVPYPDKFFWVFDRLANAS